MSDSSALLSLHDVSLVHGQQTLLDRVNLSLSARQIMTIIGPNGAGKSTLLHIALGLQKPSSGTVSRQPKLRVGYMPQKLRINPLMPVTVSRFLRMSSLNRPASPC